MPKDPLAREQEMVIQVACHALTRTIEQYSPVGTDTLPIATAATGRYPSSGALHLVRALNGFTAALAAESGDKAQINPGHGRAPEPAAA
jgi:hypothetical protein